MENVVFFLTQTVKVLFLIFVAISLSVIAVSSIWIVVVHFAEECREGMRLLKRGRKND